MWIARDKNGSLSLYACKPIEIGGSFYVHDGFNRLDYDTNYVKGWYIDGINRNLFPEVTFENSPQEVELKLVDKLVEKITPTSNNSKITIGTKIRSKTNPSVIMSIISDDCHYDKFELSNGSVLSLKQIEKYYDIII